MSLVTGAAQPPPFKLASINRTTLRPTLRALWIFAAGLPLGIVLIAISRALWIASLAYALIVLVLLCADILLILPRRSIDVRVRAPGRLPVAETSQLRVDLSTLPLRRAVRFRMILEQSGVAAPPEASTVMTSAGRLAVLLPILPLRRGQVRLEALWLRWAGPFGLVERRWRLLLQRPIDVVPVIRGQRGAPLNVEIADARFGTKIQLQRGEGSEFETLREHVPGLDNRTIDWKRSARHTKLLSKVFRTERNHSIILAFDTGHLMVEPIDGKTRLDHAIEAGLMLAWTSLKGGDLVGTFAFDARLRQYLAPASGLTSLSRLQQAVARLDYATEETNFTLGLAELNQRLMRRALVVLFTEFIDTITAELLLDSLKRIANRHLVIFVTLQDPQMTALRDAAPDGFMAAARAVIAADLLRERAIVLERLARLGVQVLDVPAGQLSVKLVERYLQIKERGLL